MFWRRQWHPIPVLLPRKSHGRRSLVGCSPWGRSESDTTERLHFHFSLSCIGEGNGNPLQCSCLENPRDGGAWWAAIFGVAQSRTRLKWLSSSSSSSNTCSQVLPFLLYFHLEFLSSFLSPLWWVPWELGMQGCQGVYICLESHCPSYLLGKNDSWRTTASGRQTWHLNELQVVGCVGDACHTYPCSPWPSHLEPRIPGLNCLSL